MTSISVASSPNRHRVQLMPAPAREGKPAIQSNETQTAYRRRVPVADNLKTVPLVCIEWEQPHKDSPGLGRVDTYFARLSAPFYSQAFASISRRITNDGFVVAVFHCGLIGKGPVMYARYQSADKARRDIERRTLAHWRTIAKPEPIRHVVARSTPSRHGVCLPPSPLQSQLAKVRPAKSILS